MRNWSDSHQSLQLSNTKAFAFPTALFSFCDLPNTCSDELTLCIFVANMYTKRLSYVSIIMWDSFSFNYQIGF